jgi:hypothetical protein
LTTSASRLSRHAHERRAGPLDRVADRIICEMCIALRGRRLPMAERLSDDRHTFAQPGEHAGKAMP